MLQDEIRTTGAVVMGRHAYGMGRGDFTGYEFQVPIFVVTHRAPPKPARGENERLKFTFVTDGIESAIDKAKAAAGDKDVTVVGGAQTFQQVLEKGLADEIEIGFMPILLGEGLRLFEHLDTRKIGLEKIRVMESAGGRTDIFFRVVKPGA
jgi:dihydrofolate reductase